MWTRHNLKLPISISRGIPKGKEQKNVKNYSLFNQNHAKETMMLDHTCDNLKEHVEEEMLATSVDEGMSVESPELHLFVTLFI